MTRSLFEKCVCIELKNQKKDIYIILLYCVSNPVQILYCSASLIIFFLMPILSIPKRSKSLLLKIKMSNTSIDCEIKLSKY